jgi:hypothetical protein
MSDKEKGIKSAIDNVEPTPKMIQAGADEVWEFRGFDPNFVAERVFRAVILAGAKKYPGQLSSSE